MKNLFKEFGQIFNPTAALDHYKEIFYNNWTILKHLTPDDEMFGMYIDLVDSELDYLRVEFNYVPFWADEYNRFTELYFADMEVKVIETGFKFNLN